MVLHLVRIDANRDPRHMFSAGRLLAMLRLPKRYRRKGEFIPEWPAMAGTNAQEFLATLECVLTRDNAVLWESLPPLLGAAAITSAWHPQSDQ